MKFKKIQEQIIKEAYKVRPKSLYFDEDPENVYVCDGEKIYIIGQRYFFLDVDKLIESDCAVGRWNRRELKKFFDLDMSKYNDAILSPQLIKHGKDYLNVLSNEENSVYVNSTFLNVFDNPTFKISGTRSPILVYDDTCYNYSVLSGYLLPVSYHGGN